jgi:hypothetical protein
MKEIKVRAYGQWTSYTYMKYNKEILAIALSGVGKRLRGVMTIGIVTMNTPIQQIYPNNNGGSKKKERKKNIFAMF